MKLGLFLIVQVYGKRGQTARDCILDDNTYIGTQEIELYRTPNITIQLILLKVNNGNWKTMSEMES